MFHIGQKVIYGVHGVCEIIAVDVQRINRKNIEYFVLTSVDQPGSRFYIPTHNETALMKLRPLLTKEQIESILLTQQGGDDLWIADENKRKQHYKELICSGDRAALVGMVRCIYKHRKQQEAEGRKIHLSDEDFLKEAEKLLCAEFSIILGISKNDVIIKIK